MHDEVYDGEGVVFRRGRDLLAAFGDYLGRCEAAKTFPNLAGFCRHCGCAMADMARVARRFPSAHARMMAALEDAALNADKSASLVNAYLKHRLGYGEVEGEGGEQVLIDPRLMADGE